MNTEITTKPDLVKYIKEEYAAGGVGSATKKGMLYQEIPFPGYESIPAQREGSDARFSALVDHIDFAGKQVLDIGCNVGFFCFQLARKGARCWGLDHDANSLVIADSLKRIHGVDSVQFYTGQFSAESLQELVADAGHFDVVLLNSVIHWLIQEMGSIRQVQVLLNRIPARGTQYIVYEPSSTNKAYAPEQLEQKNIRKFFRGLGADRVERIARSYVTNARTHREYWLGEKNPKRIVSELDQALGDEYQHQNLAMIGAHKTHEKRDKIAFRFRDVFIKTVKTPKSPYNLLLKNEAATAVRMMEYPEIAPLFIGEMESRGRRFLIYEALDVRELDSFNTSRDAIWITRELKRIPELLRKMKIVHNDIRPANILVLRAEQELRLIDYEFSDRDVIQPPPDKKTYSPLKPTSDPETRMLEELIPILQAGGEGRGTGSFAGDGRAVTEIIRMVMLKKKPVWRVALHTLKQRLNRYLSALRFDRSGRSA